MQIQDHHDIDARRFREEIMPAAQPAVFRGLAADWPAVRAATSAEGIAAYLTDHAADHACDMLIGPPEIHGCFFYNADMSGLNFERRPSSLPEIVAALMAALHDPAPPAIAAQAIEARTTLPGFSDTHRLDLIGIPVAPRLWIGNQVVVSAHHDMFSNIAVVVAGKRRFTLFPPDQASNLAIGPFEFTPAGTPVSLIDFDAPDPARFPGFADALAVSQTADLAPGDAIYIPYMWWHHVRATERFNMLANYWWNEAPPAQPGLQPIDALVHAFLAFSGLPAEQRAAWAPMFEQLVFAEDAAAHVPAERRGIRGTLGEDVKHRIRQQLGGLMTR
ncbi:cupin-like domain-containing protein [Sphingomonas sp.]|uniref:cupin-like domain-containing protein n=1 Tax=Sphingomonas sp. TaxID=28214 RepID=UPI003B3AC9C7